DKEFDSMNMFARLLSLFIIRTSAEWCSVVEVYNITTITRLGWNFPAQLILFNFTGRRNLFSSFFSYIYVFHLNFPPLLSIYAYNSIQCLLLSIQLWLKINIYFLLKPIDISIQSLLLCQN